MSIMTKSSLPRSILLAIALCYSTCAQYTLLDDYTPSTFFSMFNFFTGGDPTNGFVQYVDMPTAQSSNLIQTFDDHVFIGVDNTTTFATTDAGRPSVRISSTATYNKGLFILTLSHMPFGCGAWPAFWTLGSGTLSWPTYGEIDIIEGVNSDANNHATLHTGPNCSIAGTGETGTLLLNNCTSSPSDNQGCGIEDTNTQSFGDGFNSNGGGVYAMEWTSDYIQTWFFAPDAVPASITSGTPDPTTFGEPMANFAGDCDFDTSFANHNIIFDVTFCGDYAGNTYAQSTCPNASGGYDACTAYVAGTPDAFSETYWAISGLQVYQDSATSARKNFIQPTSSVVPAAEKTPSISASLRYAGMGVPAAAEPTLS